MAGSPNRPEEKRKTVLIIEDDVPLLQAYEVVLKKENVTMLTARDGDEALAFLDGDPPNVVLLDLLLPGMSGFEILEAIRRNERWKDVPVIVLSNLGQSQDIERSKALGVKYYMVKANAKISEIMARVKEFL